MAATKKDQPKGNAGSERPKRPLSAFNLFYRFKRLAVIRATSSSSSARSLNDETSKKEAVQGIIDIMPGLEWYTPADHAYLQTLTEDQVKETRRATIRASLHANISANQHAEKRSHRKTHGALSFVQMNKLMCNGWKGADDFAKEVFNELANEGRAVYHAQLAEYKKKYPSEQDKLAALKVAKDCKSGLSASSKARESKYIPNKTKQANKIVRKRSSPSSSSIFDQVENKLKNQKTDIAVPVVHEVTPKASSKPCVFDTTHIPISYFKQSYPPPPEFVAPVSPNSSFESMNCDLFDPLPAYPDSSLHSCHSNYGYHAGPGSYLRSVTNVATSPNETYTPFTSVATHSSFDIKYSNKVGSELLSSSSVSSASADEFMHLLESFNEDDTKEEKGGDEIIAAMITLEPKSQKSIKHHPHMRDVSATSSSFGTFPLLPPPPLFFRRKSDDDKEETRCNGLMTPAVTESKTTIQNLLPLPFDYEEREVEDMKSLLSSDDFMELFSSLN